MTSNKCLKYNNPTKPQKAYTCEWFDLNHFSWAGSDLSEVYKLCLETRVSSPSISLGPKGRGLYILFYFVCSEAKSLVSENTWGKSNRHSWVNKYAMRRLTLVVSVRPSRKNTIQMAITVNSL